MSVWKHPLYSIWYNITQRCYNPKSEKYPIYGGRGIIMCDRWKNDVKLFIEDNQMLYKKGLSIDRIDNDGIYEPSNCRWVTSKEQARNRRSNIKVEYKGRVYIAKELCEILDIKYKTFWMGINTYKFTVDKAVELGLRNKTRNVNG